MSVFVVVAGCAGLAALFIALDVLLGYKKFAKTDARLEKVLGRFRYKGW